MPSNVTATHTLLLIGVIAVLSFILRAAPFILFRSGHTPAIVTYLGRVMPPAVIGMLVIYCFAAIDFTRWQAFVPALIAAGIVVLLHIWKKNSLLSIGVGTVAYMLMIQLVFK